MGPDETVEVEDRLIYIEGNAIKGIEPFEADLNSEECQEYIRNSLTAIPDYKTGTITVKITNFNIYALYKLIGLWDWVIANCPNKRVVHLIKNGKNNKIKHKNFRRATRILGNII